MASIVSSILERVATTVQDVKQDAMSVIAQLAQSYRLILLHSLRFAGDSSWSSMALIWNDRS